MSYAIIRNTNYKMKNLSGVYRHNERKNINYSNQDIDKDKSKENYSLKEPNTTYEKLFKIVKEKYNLKGQIKSVSNVACEYIITSDKEYFKTLGKEGTERFFKTAYSFACNYKNLGEQYILSAKVHMDERTPHMHLVFIPVVHTKDKKGNEIDKIACSEFWKGKNSYKDLQDNFYDYMTTYGFNLERGKESNKEHLSIEQLKDITNYDKMKEYIEKTPIQETNTNSLEIALEENKRLIKHSNTLREYCIKSAKTFEQCKKYEKGIEELKQENTTLKDTINQLKDNIKNIFNIVTNVFKISKEKIFNLLEKEQIK